MPRKDKQPSPDRVPLISAETDEVETFKHNQVRVSPCIGVAYNYHDESWAFSVGKGLFALNIRKGAILNGSPAAER